MKGYLIIVAVSLTVAGCSIKTQGQRAIDEQRQSSQEYSTILQAGIDPSGYERSRYGKVHDVAGFIRTQKDRQTKESNAKRAQFDQELPMILKRVKGCVLGNNYLNQKELPVAAKRCFPDDRDFGRTPPAWKDEVTNKVVVELTPYYASVYKKMQAEAHQQAVQDRAQAAQDKREREAAAQRAYDNSLRSLVE